MPLRNHQTHKASEIKMGKKNVVEFLCREQKKTVCRESDEWVSGVPGQLCEHGPLRLNEVTNSTSVFVDLTYVSLASVKRNVVSVSTL